MKLSSIASGAQEKAAAADRKMTNDRAGASSLGKAESSAVRNSAPTKSETAAAGNEADLFGSYIKVLSRIENSARQGQLSGEEKEQILEGIVSRIKSMGPAQQKRMLSLDFLKSRNVVHLESMRETLSRAFSDPEQQQDLFSFLKSNDFTSLLLNKQPTVGGYANNSPARSGGSLGVA